MGFTENPKRFDCATCPLATQEIRRCREDRLDFTPEDNVSVFPIRISEGGSLFGFCPGKATWYPDVAALYRMLLLVAETSNLPYDGALMDQPDWIIELMGFFVPRYKAIQFASRARSILGDGKSMAAIKSKVPAKG